MNESTLSKNEIIAQLCRSPHGKYLEYVPIVARAVKYEPDFLAHLIAWNALKGQIRDSKVAIPVITLSAPSFDEEFVENSLAHLATLDPRNLLKAYTFAREIKTGRSSRLKATVRMYLENLESNIGRWDRVALQHRQSLKSLYALTHAKRSEHVGAVLFGGEGSKKSGKPIVKVEYPTGSLFWVVANLKNMDPMEAAGHIITRKIPFLIAIGALGEKAKTTELVLALIGRMSPTELTNNSKMLEKLGVRTVPALRAAYEDALTKAAKSKTNTLKASVAAEQVEDPALKEKLKQLQEKQIAAQASIDGDWLILGDKSGSMTKAIQTSRYVAGTLAKLVKGKVYLAFFDIHVYMLDVTGMDLEQIEAKTRTVTANGGTSIGAGVESIRQKKVHVDGIAVVSDGGHWTPPNFSTAYKSYCRDMDTEPSVYFYRVEGNDRDSFTDEMRSAQIGMEVFDLGNNVDYYSLPNLARTMRVNRYSLVDEIMNTPLLKLEEVFRAKKNHIGSGVSAQKGEVYA